MSGPRRFIADAYGSRLTPAFPLLSSSFARSSIQRVTPGIGWAAVRRVVLETSVLWRIVRRGDNDAIGESDLCVLDCRPEWRARSPASGSPPSSAG